MAKESSVPEERMLAVLVPQGIVCVESALFHFGYSDFAPRKWSIAIPRSMSRTKLKIDTLAIQPYYVQENLYGLGKTVMALLCLYMTGNAPFATALNIAAGWTMSCLPRL
jgi:predicted transcriptional regulator of viral defense system